MRKMLAPVLLTALTLAACSSADHASTEEAPQGGDARTGTVAYGFTYRFALPSMTVDQAQDRHVALCDRLGPVRCRMLEMHRSAGAGGPSGSARFVVAAGDARRFGEALIGSVAALDGKLESRDFEAQDLATERADARANVAEKNSAANRAALSAVQERLRMSTVWTQYEGKTGFAGQIGEALGAVGDTLTTSIVMLIYFLSGALPWALALAAIFLLVRAGVRWARRARAGRPPGTTAPLSAEPGI